MKAIRVNGKVFLVNENPTALQMHRHYDKLARKARDKTLSAMRASIHALDAARKIHKVGIKNGRGRGVFTDTMRNVQLAHSHLRIAANLLDETWD
jgi:hypothetical protein